MPLEICKFSRHNRIKICKNEFETAPSKGFCASQNSWFYGYKLHGVCSVTGVFHSLDITKAEVHDINFLKNIKQQMSDCVLLGDRGYLSESIQLDLFQTVNVKLETPKRLNQKDYKPQPYIFRKSRKFCARAAPCKACATSSRPWAPSSPERPRSSGTTPAART